MVDVMTKFYKIMKAKLVLFFIAFTFYGCYNQKDIIIKKLDGDWELINPRFSQQDAVNVALNGIRFYADSLEFFGDYMSNPLFNLRKYSLTKDSIIIEFNSGLDTFAFKHNNDTLSIEDCNYTYRYVKIHTDTKNQANRIKFVSQNPGWEEKRYFFDFTIDKNGVFEYNSKSEKRELEGIFKKKYTDYIFDKIHNINFPIQTSNNELIITHNHFFTLEVFTGNTRLDSLTYSKDIEDPYMKWLSSLLQSIPLWVEDAITEE